MSRGARPRPPSRRRATRGGRRALAADLRRHDHAADGAVHGAVLDLLGQRLQVHDAAALAEGRILRQASCPAARSIAQQGATSSPRKAPSTAEAVALVPLAATGSGQEATTRASTQSSSQSASSASVSTVSIQHEAAAQNEASVFAHIKHELDSLRRRARLQEERADDDRTARPGHQGAHRRPAVRLRQGRPRHRRATRC